jgi:hypothetical protein
VAAGRVERDIDTADFKPVDNPKTDPHKPTLEC